VIEPCKRLTFFACLLFAVIGSAFGQRAAVGIGAGETTDRFGALPSSSTAVGVVNADFIVIRANAKEQYPSIVAGGEIRFPADTAKHASEFSAYAGPMFRFGTHLSLGFHAQVHKILLPASVVDGQEFPRYNMLLLELPGVLEYKFSSAPNHAFFQAQVSPEFGPHFTAPKAGSSYPKPILDHGYFFRGTLGYVVGKWYAKGTYESRYFKFSPTLGNPNLLDNWKTNYVMGGVGVVF